MTGYTRKDTSNNIADGNIVNAADLDNEFDGVQAAFVAATGHTHDGTASEGAAITKIGPVQDVVVSIAAMYPKTTNTVDLGTSSLKYKDAFFAGNETVGGTLAVTGVTTLTAQPVLSSLTASQAVFTDASKGLVSNAITGTGNVVMSTSPTLVTPALGTPSSGVVTNLTGTASININGTVGATTANTGAFTTLGATGNVTLGDASTDTVTVNGYVGVGGAVNSSRGINIGNSALSGTTQRGLHSNITGTSGATSAIIGVSSFPITEAATFTVADVMAFQVGTVSKGAGSTITNQHGVYISDQTQGTNNYGITSLVSSGTNKWNVYASGTAANYFAGDLRVGTSTAFASEKLSVFGSTFNDLAAGNGSANTSYDWLVGASGNTAFPVKIVVDQGATSTTHGMSFYTSNAATPVERMRLDASGNVGIGTSSPTSTLSVTGTANVTGNVTLGDATTDTVTVNGYMGVGVAANTSTGVIVQSAALLGVDQRGGHFDPTGTASATSQIVGVWARGKTAAAVFTTVDLKAITAADATKGAGSTITNQHGLYIANQTQGTNNYGITSLVSSGTDKWNIYASGTAQNYFAGNVGIGTNTPSDKLQVIGDVLIGTDSGSAFNGDAFLKIQNDGPAYIGVKAGISNTAGILFGDIDDSFVGGMQYSNTDNALFFNANNAERLRIDSAGNVGIGTTTPTAKLDVNGTVNVPLSSSYIATVLDRPSIRPSLLLDFANTRVLDPRITFTRASTATFYDNDSSAVAEQNLFTYSQEFDNDAWTKVRSSVTTNATTAPDNTTTADSLTQVTTQTTSGYVSQTVSCSIASYTISIFAKADTKNYIIINETVGTGSGRFTWFNVSTGTVGTTNGGHTASIVSAGNGWYRCSITFAVNAARSGQINYYLADSDNSTTVVDSGSISLWGAQLEQRSAVTAYTPTTTAAITNYIPVMQTAASGAARFDCNPVTRESLGLLIEESRTNLLTYSDQFDDASWSKLNSSITANTLVAPDGTLTGDKVVENSTSSVHTAEKTFSVTSGTTYTVSAFIKKAERAFALIALITGFPTTSIQINLTTGAVTTGTGTPLNAFSQDVGNGWFKVGFSLAANSTTTASANFYTSTDGVWANRVYLGDGYSGLYIWGAQLEAGAFATSYIPTVASQVTRAADAASMTGTNFSAWYNVGQGSLYSEFSKSWLSGTATAPFQLVPTSGGQGIMGWINTDGLNFRQWVGGTSSTLGLLSTSASNKAVTAYGPTNAGSLNGATAVANTGVVPTDIVSASIGKYGSGYLNGTLKRLAYYPVRLSNTELQGLTS